MKTSVRIVIIGISIWILGVSMYLLSYYIPILKNPEFQANLFLMLAVIPLVWFGTKIYYQKQSSPNGIILGLAFFTIAACLDALFTVPYLIIPNGGSYKDFFMDLGFWLIGMEFILVAIVYRSLNKLIK